MRLIKSALAAALLVSASYGYAQQMSAEEFAVMAASSDLFEIQSSELALERTDKAAVREFAQMMVTDHTKASEELKAAAQKAQVSVPSEMSEKHVSQLQQLEAAPDAEFDTAYIAAQQAGHKEALALMQGYAQNGDSEPLKAHASKTAPIIQQHLEHAQKLTSQ
jgi:putative membrane protein